MFNHPGLSQKILTSLDTATTTAQPPLGVEHGAVGQGGEWFTVNDIMGMLDLNRSGHLYRTLDELVENGLLFRRVGGCGVTCRRYYSLAFQVVLIPRSWFENGHDERAALKVGTTLIRMNHPLYLMMPRYTVDAFFLAAVGVVAEYMVETL